VNKKKQIIHALGLLVVWISIQTVDVVHHFTHQHEEVCETEGSHVCEDHVEVEVCDLCAVLYQGYDIEQPSLVGFIHYVKTDYQFRNVASNYGILPSCLWNRGPPKAVA